MKQEYQNSIIYNVYHFVREGDPGIVIAYADAQSIHNVLGLLSVANIVPPLN